jgi:hypothetical protein
MGSRLAVLDESKSQHHPIISVGGFVAEMSDVGMIEDEWRRAKCEIGLDPERPIKYTMSWPDQANRGAMIATIGTLPVVVVVALLEDFRPARFGLRKQTRGELYIHRPAFEYVLQRLVEDQYCPADEGAHFVVFDHRDDFRRLSETYSKCHDNGWRFAGRSLPSLRSRGWSASLTAASEGPLNEIADLLVSTTTRWAGARCAIAKGRQMPEQAELDRDMLAIVERFPASPTSIPTRRRGYSIITHTGNRTGKELLYDNIDRWLNELASP